MAGNQLIICYIIWRMKPFKAASPDCTLNSHFSPSRMIQEKDFFYFESICLINISFANMYAVCGEAQCASFYLMPLMLFVLQYTTYVQLLLLATLQFCQNHWASNISFSTRTEMKLRVCAFLLCFLVMVKAMPQFSEKQVESLAFIRLNPCERAIWR